jgi:hypothetical protein
MLLFMFGLWSMKATANDGARVRFFMRAACTEAVASAHRPLAHQNLDHPSSSAEEKTETGRRVLVAGSDLLDDNQLSIARTAIAHAGGVGFRSLTPTEGKRATPVRRPRTVIVANDGLRFAVAKCDAVDGHSGVPP